MLIPTCKQLMYAGGAIAKAISFVNRNDSYNKDNSANDVSVIKNNVFDDLITESSNSSSSSSDSNNNNSESNENDSKNSCRSSSDSNNGIDNRIDTNEDTYDLKPTERFKFIVGCCLWEAGELER